MSPDINGLLNRAFDADNDALRVSGAAGTVAPKAFTPSVVLNGTGSSLGTFAGQAGYWYQTGYDVTVKVLVLLSNDFTFGTGITQWGVDLDVTDGPPPLYVPSGAAATMANGVAVGTLYAVDAGGSGNYYIGASAIAPATSGNSVVVGFFETAGPLDHDVPFDWTNGGALAFDGVYSAETPA